MPAERRADEALLVVALSARGLAAAARRSGYAPVVVDFWLDQDTRRLSRAGFRLGGKWRRGFRRASLLAAAGAMVAATRPLGIVCGTGFEDRPGLLTALASLAPLLGNDAETVRRVKRPWLLAGLARALGIPHPEIRDIPCSDPGWPDPGWPDPGWVQKRVGGSGGAHVVPADPSRPERIACGRYWQRKVTGAPISALLLSNGARSIVLGFSAQWTDPTRGAPFRYAGAVRPAPENPHRAAMADAANRLACAAGLRGLNSVDFLVGESGFHMIEINPRPGASLDVFRHADLMRLHVRACAGDLPEMAPVFPGAMATRIVFADRRASVPPGYVWPAWTADQESGRSVAAGEPICSVFAETETETETGAGAGDPATARALVDARAAQLLAELRAA